MSFYTPLPLKYDEEHFRWFAFNFESHGRDAKYASDIITCCVNEIERRISELEEDMTDEEYAACIAEQDQQYQEDLIREEKRECKAITSLVAACHALRQHPNLPRLQAMLKACGGPPIRRQRLKELLSDYLR